MTSNYAMSIYDMVQLRAKGKAIPFRGIPDRGLILAQLRRRQPESRIGDN